MRDEQDLGMNPGPFVSSLHVLSVPVCHTSFFLNSLVVSSGGQATLLTVTAINM